MTKRPHVRTVSACYGRPGFQEYLSALLARHLLPAFRSVFGDDISKDPSAFEYVFGSGLRFLGRFFGRQASRILKSERFG